MPSTSRSLNRRSAPTLRPSVLNSRPAALSLPSRLPKLARPPSQRPVAPCMPEETVPPVTLEASMDFEVAALTSAPASADWNPAGAALAGHRPP